MMYRALWVSFLFCAVVLYFLAANEEIKRTPDSLFYIEAAEYHTAGEMMRNYDHNGRYGEIYYKSGDYFVQWAPGYPLVLAQFFRAGIGWEAAARVINAVAAGLIVLGLLYGLRRYAGWVQASAVLAFVGYPGIRMVNEYAMTEMLFMAVVTWAVVLDW